MKKLFPILLLSISASALAQSGPGHNGNRTGVHNKVVHHKGEYTIKVSPEMKHDSLMVAKYNYKLDSLQKWEGRYYAHDSLRMIPWTDSLNKYRAKYSYDLQVADQAARRAIKK